MRFPFSRVARSSGHSAAVPGAPAPERAEQGWRGLPAMVSRAGLAPVGASPDFGDRLAAWRNPARTGTMTHLVSRDAPSGLVHGLLRPVVGRTAGQLTQGPDVTVLPVARRTPAAGEQWDLPALSTPATLQRRLGAVETAGAGTPAAPAAPTERRRVAAVAGGSDVGVSTPALARGVVPVARPAAGGPTTLEVATSLVAPEVAPAKAATHPEVSSPTGGRSHPATTAPAARRAGTMAAEPQPEGADVSQARRTRGAAPELTVGNAAPGSFGASAPRGVIQRMAAPGAPVRSAAPAAERPRSAEPIPSAASRVTNARVATGAPHGTVQRSALPTTMIGLPVGLAADPEATQSRSGIPDVSLPHGTVQRSAVTVSTTGPAVDIGPVIPATADPVQRRADAENASAARELAPGPVGSAAQGRAAEPSVPVQRQGVREDARPSVAGGAAREGAAPVVDASPLRIGLPLEAEQVSSATLAGRSRPVAEVQRASSISVPGLASGIVGLGAPTGLPMPLRAVPLGSGPGAVPRREPGALVPSVSSEGAGVQSVQRAVSHEDMPRSVVPRGAGAPVRPDLPAPTDVGPAALQRSVLDPGGRPLGLRTWRPDGADRPVSPLGAPLSTAPAAAVPLAAAAQTPTSMRATTGPAVGVPVATSPFDSTTRQSDSIPRHDAAPGQARPVQRSAIAVPGSLPEPSGLGARTAADTGSVLLAPPVGRVPQQTLTIGRLSSAAALVTAAVAVSDGPAPVQVGRQVTLASAPERVLPSRFAVPAGDGPPPEVARSVKAVRAVHYPEFSAPASRPLVSLQRRGAGLSGPAAVLKPTRSAGRPSPAPAPPRVAPTLPAPPARPLSAPTSTPAPTLVPLRTAGPSSTPSAPAATAGSSSPVQPGPEGLAEPELDVLARRLLGPLARLLRAELRLDRERIGRLRDPRR